MPKQDWRLVSAGGRGKCKGCFGKKEPGLAAEVGKSSSAFVVGQEPWVLRSPKMFQMEAVL